MQGIDNVHFIVCQVYHNDNQVHTSFRSGKDGRMRGIILWISSKVIQQNSPKLFTDIGTGDYTSGVEEDRGFTYSKKNSQNPNKSLSLLQDYPVQITLLLDV